MEKTFDVWMAKVNRAIGKKAGVSADDLPDQPYYDWYEDEMSPEEAANEALEDAGFPG